MGTVENTVRQAGYKYLKKAIESYDDNRELYKRSLAGATYIMIDTSSNKTYPLKVLVALSYMIYTHSAKTYSSFSRSFTGKEAHKELVRNIIGNNNPNLIVPDIDEEIEEIEHSTQNLEGGERMAVIKARINQSTFRKQMLSLYHGCALCGMDLDNALIVSHIRPWAECSPKEKTDTNNALLLCACHDKLFDRHLISFKNDGSILISKKISAKNRKLLNIDDKDHLLIDMSSATKKFMKSHRDRFADINFERFF